MLSRTPVVGIGMFPFEYDLCVNLRSIIFKVLFYYNVIRYFIITIMFSPESIMRIKVAISGSCRSRV